MKRTHLREVEGEEQAMKLPRPDNGIAMVGLFMVGGLVTLAIMCLIVVMVR
jgi:hypothetical protein